MQSWGLAHNQFVWHAIGCLFFGCRSMGNDGESIRSELSGLSNLDETYLTESCDAPVDYLKVDGVGFVGTAFMNESTSKLDIERFDPRTFKVCRPEGVSGAVRHVQYQPTRAYDGDLQLMLGRDQILFKPSEFSWHGYTSGPVSCGLARKLLKIPESEKLESEDDTCIVKLDSEHENWFAITIEAPGVTDSTDSYDKIAEQDADLRAALDAHASGIDPLPIDVTLTAGQINRRFDYDRILDALRLLHRKYQSTDPREGASSVMVGIYSSPERAEQIKGEDLYDLLHRQKNTCMRNVRTVGWLDLQAHLYCILPYFGYRECYSSFILTETGKIAPGTPVREALAKMLEAMHGAYGQCFAPGAAFDFAKDFQDPNELDLVRNVFKQVNFVKQGIMDFNLTQELGILTEFYEELKKTDPWFKDKDERLTRFMDSVPWSGDQLRYFNIRQQQKRILGPAP